MHYSDTDTEYCCHISCSLVKVRVKFFSHKLSCEFIHRIKVKMSLKESKVKGNHLSNVSSLCCLIDCGKACPRAASNASYSNKIQGTVNQKKLRLELNPSSSHFYICDFHKTMIQSVRTKRKRRESEGSSEKSDGHDKGGREYLDLFQLQMNTLKRYKKHFKLSSRPGLNKTQLAEQLTKHLKSIPVVEKEALAYFIYMVKTKKSRLEQSDMETDLATTETI